MTAIPIKLLLVSCLVVALSLLTVAGALAQDDSWSLIVTPQLWLSHIDKNGFAPSVSAASFLVPGALATKTEPVDSINPQWGLQIAAQKGRWTLAGSFQYATFETRTDFKYVLPNRTCNVFDPFGTLTCINTGERFGQAFTDTTRLDMDFAASYLFPDVVKNFMDLSVGAGIKIIYASASREFGNLSPLAAAINGLTPPGLFLVCGKDDCSDLTFKDRVKVKTLFYGLTIPVSTVFHLTSDATWLLPISVTPFVGAETRDDQDVVYAGTGTGSQFRVKRLDGTTFAYGGTVDATIRWLINDTVSAYAGMRVQYIKGHEQFLAYGPLVGMSVRFGGK